MSERSSFVWWPHGRQQWSRVALNVIAIVGAVFMFIGIGMVRAAPLPVLVTILVVGGAIRLGTSIARRRAATSDGADPIRAQPSRRWRRWQIVIAVGTVLACLAVLVVAIANQSGGDASADARAQVSDAELQAYLDSAFPELRGALPGAPIAKVSVDSLLQAYQENEFAAAARFENATTLDECISALRDEGCPVVEVSGTLQSLSRDGDLAHVWLAGSDGIQAIRSQFGKSEFDSLVPLRPQQKVAVRCVVSYEKWKVMLTRCEIAG